MQIALPTKILAGLSTLLSIQVTAFVVFHLSMGLIFEIEWVKLVLVHDWLGTLHWLIEQAALYAPAVLFIWMIFTTGCSKSLLALMAAGTLYSAYYWQYPMLTGFLYALGQFEWFPDFLFGNMPGTDQYPRL